MRTAFALLIFVHGSIHLLGFLKAFHLAEIPQLTQQITAPIGVLWGVTTVLFVTTAIIFLLKLDHWLLVAAASVALSQVLILIAWQDAKFGTAANLIILVVAVVGYGALTFETPYRQDVEAGVQRSGNIAPETVLERDLQHLPIPIQAYLNYVGVVGTPRVRNVKIVFRGEMRDQDKGWFPFTSEQYNFMDRPERFFFMKAQINGVPTYGYHTYKDGQAHMVVKLLSLFPVVNLGGTEMNQAETVTFFNDLCLFAPAALINPEITWESIDNYSATARFTYRDITIAATLYVNEEGQLVNFVSDDRFAHIDGAMKSYLFSTPVSQYKRFEGLNLPTYGEAIWQYPDGPFTYGKFQILTIEYNVTSDQLQP